MSFEDFKAMITHTHFFTVKKENTNVNHKTFESNARKWIVTTLKLLNGMRNEVKHGENSFDVDNCL